MAQDQEQVMADRRGHDWCILRTGASRTLALAASLSAAGFDVWTPTETRSRRKGRSRERVDYAAPIMPTFVFARAAHVADLAAVASLPFTAHPGFSIFRHLGRVPLVSEAEVAGARRIEDRCKRAAVMGQRRTFAIGQSVRVTEGAATGLIGEVVADGDGKYILVAFDRVTLKIGAWLLGTEAVQETPIAA
ncbi:transcription termination/antitermination protein NusG [Sphingomonas sp. Leaf17]|uniref:transcription termination/antitermination protein NusG n=1 Tax=Sphingomonas sp. Leaf17 TaxID=1735683 RepID=UPI000B06D979|nr:hypothetical protein [Sphingomonas sp. Leaf17]